MKKMMTQIFRSIPAITFCAVAGLATLSCDSGGGSSTSGPGGAQSMFGSGGGADRDPNILGESCKSSDPNHICLGVKFVTYTDSTGKPVADTAAAIAGMKATNQIWNQCNLGFQIEEYVAVDPADYNLAYSGGTSAGQTDQIRQAFGTKDALLVAYTGPWGTTKNAWTAMPGSALYGAVIEAGVVNYPAIQAHELGHYLGLDHISDESNLMNAVIYKTPNQISSSQCDTARATAETTWHAMMR